MSWLDTRTPRERILVFVAALLTIVLLSWQFGVRPTLEAHADAKKAQSTALRDFNIVQSGLPKMTAGPNTAREPFSRVVMLQVANENQISISRVQPGQDGELQLWFEDTQTAHVYAFLSQITGQYATRIGRVQINSRDGGLINAQVTLQSAP